MTTECLAHDVRHARTVALDVLRPALSVVVLGWEIWRKSLSWLHLVASGGAGPVPDRERCG